LIAYYKRTAYVSQIYVDILLEVEEGGERLEFANIYALVYLPMGGGEPPAKSTL